MKLIKQVILILLLILVFTTGCFPLEYKTWRPEEGVWYCEELQLQFSFEFSAETYIIIDGHKVTSQWECDPGSSTIMLLCQEKGFQDYNLGEGIFAGKYVSLDEKQYVVKDRDSGEIYTFVRID